MPEAKKGSQTLLWVIILVLVVVVGAVVAYLVSTNVPEKPKAAVGNFVEGFTTTTYKDSGATTADWNTSLPGLVLPQTNAYQFMKPDGVTPGFSSLNTEASIGGGANTSQVGVTGMKLDSAGRPNVAWTNTFSGDLYFSRWDGSAWKKMDGSAGADTICTGGGTCADYISAFGLPSLVLNSSGYPMIAYGRTNSVNPHSITVREWNGTSWAAPVDITGGLGMAGSFQSPQLATTGTRFALTFTDVTGYRIQYVTYKSGSTWTGNANTNVDADNTTFEADEMSSLSGIGTDQTFYGSVAYDDAGKPGLMWYQTPQMSFAPANADVMYTKWDDSDQLYEQANGSAGAGIVSADVNGWCTGCRSLAFDSANRPHIAFEGAPVSGPSEVLYTKWNGSGWVGANNVAGYTNVSNTTSGLLGATAGISIALDDLDKQVIAWGDNIAGPALNYDVYVAQWNSSSFVGLDSGAVTQVTTAATGASFPSFEILPGTDQPVLAYTENSEVNVSQWAFGTSYTSPAVAQSTNIYSGSGQIASATMSSLKPLPIIPDGTVYNHFLSNDGGANFYPVTESVPFTFPTLGNDLRWKMEIAKTGAGFPEVYSVIVDYVDTTPTAITSCATSISDPGYYYLTGDLDCTGTSGLNIFAFGGDTTLDGDGYELSRTDSGYLLVVSADVEVKDTRFKSPGGTAFGSGGVLGSDNAVFLDNVFSNTPLEVLNNSTVIGNDFTDSPLRISGTLSKVGANAFAGRGVDASSQTPNLFCTDSGAGSALGVDNEYSDSVPLVEKAVSICGDINQNFDWDDMEKIWMNNNFERMGREIIAGNTFLAKWSPLTIDLGEPRAKILSGFGWDCPRVAFFDGGNTISGCSNTTSSLVGIGDVGIAHATNSTNQVEAELVGGNNDYRGDVIRYPKVIDVPSVNPDATIDLAVGGGGNTVTVGAVVRSAVAGPNAEHKYTLPPGLGNSVKAALEDLDFTFPAPSDATQVICYKNNVPTSYALPGAISDSGCDQLAFVSSAGKVITVIESGYGVEGEVESKFDSGSAGGFEDRKRGDANIADSPIIGTVGHASHNADGVTMATHNLDFQNLYDVVDGVPGVSSPNPEYASMSIVVAGSSVKIQATTDGYFNGGDIGADLAARTPKMALGFTIFAYPTWSGATQEFKATSAQTIVTDGVSLATPQNPLGDAPRIAVTITDLTSYSFMRPHFVNCKQAIAESGNLIEEATPCSGLKGYGLGIAAPTYKVSDNSFKAVASAGAPFTTFATSVDAGDGISSIFNAAVGIGNARGRSAAEQAIINEVNNNTVDDTKAGFGVAGGGRHTISGNTINLREDIAVELIEDSIAANLYASELPLFNDMPSDNGVGQSARGAGDEAAYQQHPSVAIADGCGKLQTNDGGYDGAVDVADGEDDFFGTKLGKWIPALDHTNCGATRINGNTITATGGVGIANHDETFGAAERVCGSAMLLNTDALCVAATGVSAANKIVDHNVITSAGVVSTDENGVTARTYDDPSPRQADGPDGCIGVVTAGRKEIRGNDLLSTASTTAVGQSVIHRPGVPTYFVADNTCGASGSGQSAGGMGSGGEGMFVFARNVITEPSYEGFDVRCGGRSKFSQTVSDFGRDIAGKEASCQTLLIANKVENPGSDLDTVKNEILAESVTGAGDGITRASLGADIHVHTDYEEGALVDAKFVIKGNTLSGNTIYFDTADLASATVAEKGTYLDNLEIILDDNTTEIGEAVGVLSSNPTFNNDVVAVAGEVLDDSLPGKINVRCATKGQGANGPCNDETVAKVYAQSCAVKYQQKASLITRPVTDNVETSGCPILAQQQFGSADSKYSYASLNVEHDINFYVVAQLGTTPGSIVYGTHPNVSKTTDGNPVKSASIFLNTSNTQFTGSELNVYSPLDVEWDADQEVYPLVLESDSNWTVDTCLFAPEGYEVQNGECREVTVNANEVVEEFVVVEVGSVPGPSKLTLTATGPNGQEQKAETTIGIRLSQALAKEKGVQVDAQGYLPGDAPALAQETPSTTPTTEPNLISPTPTTVDSLSPTTTTANTTAAKTSSSRTVLIWVIIGLVVIILGVGVAMLVTGRKKA